MGDPFGAGERLVSAPKNSVGSPPGKDRKYGRPGSGRLVLARLVWPGRVTIVPAVLEWVSSDRVLVEWRSAGASEARKTWLPREDVRFRLTYGVGSMPG